MRSGSTEAAAIVVGSEILIGRTKDTNTLFLIERLLAKGLRLGKWTIVPDEQSAISSATIGSVLEGFSPIFVSGGMGPTHDDITVEAVAKGLGLPLVRDEGSFLRMVERWKRNNPGREMPEASLDGLRKMSMVPKGFGTLPNEAGMAEGLYGKVGDEGTTMVVLPGVPREFISIVSSREFDELIPRAKEELRIAELEFRGRESQMAKTLKELQDRFPDVDIGSYPQGPMSVIVRLTGEARKVRETEEALLRLSRDRKLEIRMPDKGDGAA